MPLYRTRIKTFYRKLKEAEHECDDKGYVTIQALKNQFKTEAWVDINDKNSKLSQIL